MGLFWESFTEVTSKLGFNKNKIVIYLHMSTYLKWNNLTDKTTKNLCGPRLMLAGQNVVQSLLQTIKFIQATIDTIPCSA